MQQGVQFYVLHVRAFCYILYSTAALPCGNVWTCAPSSANMLCTIPAVQGATVDCCCAQQVLRAQGKSPLCVQDILHLSLFAPNE